MSNTTTTDAAADLLPRSWDDVDRWLLAEARELTRLRVEPETAAYVMHEHQVTLYIRAPRLCDHDADQIGRALASVIHPMRPDQVLYTFPGVAVDRTGAPTTTLRALAGAREVGWRGIQVQLPYDAPRQAVVASDVAVADDWTTHVRAIFDDAPPAPPDLSQVRHLQEEFTVAVNPTSPGAARLRQATADAEAMANRR